MSYPIKRSKLNEETKKVCFTEIYDNHSTSIIMNYEGHVTVQRKMRVFYRFKPKTTYSLKRTVKYVMDKFLCKLVWSVDLSNFEAGKPIELSIVYDNLSAQQLTSEELVTDTLNFLERAASLENQFL